MKSLRNTIYAGILGSALLLEGCSTNPYGPDLLREYKSTAEKANDFLVKPHEKVNVKILNNLGPSIYEGPEFDSRNLGTSKILMYHSKNVDVKSLKEVLDQQLKGAIEEISYLQETNQLILRMKNKENAQADAKDVEGIVNEEEIKSIIRGIDKESPQFQIEVRMVKVSAEYDERRGVFLEAMPLKEDGLRPKARIDLESLALGAAGRVFGAEYGIIKETEKYSFELLMDYLISHGTAEDIANPTLVLSNNGKARISLTQEIPYREAVVVGGAIKEETRFKEVNNFLEINAQARDNQEIYLSLNAGVGIVNPPSDILIPSATTRETSIDGVRVKQGNTLVFAGFMNSEEFVVEKKVPILSDIPLLGELFRSEEKRKVKDYILFTIEPHYIDIAKELEGKDGKAGEREVDSGKKEKKEAEKE